MNLIVLVALCMVSVGTCQCTNYTDVPAVQKFREYVKINTTTYSNLTPAVDFWKKLAAEANVPISVYEYKEGFPVIVMEWEGSDPSLPSIMLNSHMDVVPADVDDGWDYDPFGAEIDKDGNIYGRGTQDMKSVGIQHFEALRRIKFKNITLLRTCYQTVMPDEEVGGNYGMQSFLPSDEFANMNVGVSMDEGSSFQLPQMPIFYQDKVGWKIQVVCNGVAVHGSTFLPTNQTATGKCNNVINRMFEYRNEQYDVYLVATMFNAGRYTSINLNRINAGTADNVVPQEVTLLFDIRPATNLNREKFFAMLQRWISEIGDNITMTAITQNQQSPASIINSTNPYWVALNNTANDINITMIPLVAPGSTDARFVRNMGIPAFGFSPMPYTDLLLHAVNEYLNAETFLKGIDIIEAFVQSLASIPGNETSSELFSYVVRTAE